jgi:hypothetical protein
MSYYLAKLIFILIIIINFKSISLEVTLTEGSVKPTPIAVTEFFSNTSNLEKMEKIYQM